MLWCGAVAFSPIALYRIARVIKRKISAELKALRHDRYSWHISSILEVHSASCVCRWYLSISTSMGIFVTKLRAHLECTRLSRWVHGRRQRSHARHVHSRRCLGRYVCYLTRPHGATQLQSASADANRRAHVHLTDLQEALASRVPHQRLLSTEHPR